MANAELLRKDCDVRILVIDDEFEVRELLQQLFESIGYPVLTAPDGQAALRLHRATPVSLIITDIIMPEKEGLETITEFRRHFPAVKIIAISGGGSRGIKGAKEYLDIARELGAQKAFLKPFEVGKLLEAVRELLRI